MVRHHQYGQTAIPSIPQQKHWGILASPNYKAFFYAKQLIGCRKKPHYAIFSYTNKQHQLKALLGS